MNKEWYKHGTFILATGLHPYQWNPINAIEAVQFPSKWKILGWEAADQAATAGEELFPIMRFDGGDWILPSKLMAVRVCKTTELYYNMALHSESWQKLVAEAREFFAALSQTQAQRREFDPDLKCKCRTVSPYGGYVHKNYAATCPFCSHKIRE